MDIVRPGVSITDLASARAAVAAKGGPFGLGATSPDLMHVLEWFVAPPFEMLLLPSGDGRVSPHFACFCQADAFQFWGVIVDPSYSPIADLKWDVWLQPGNERAHLELIRKASPAMPSFRPHLRRAYESVVSVGFRWVDLEAGLQDGPTYWAHAGVDFSGGRPLLDHLENVALDLVGAPCPGLHFDSPDDVLTVLPRTNATIREAYLASSRISSKTGQWWIQPPGQLIHKIGLGIRIDAPRPIGEAMLHAIAPWNGVVDMTSPGASDARFRAFLGVP